MVYKNIINRRIQSFVTTLITAITVFIFVIILSAYGAIQNGLKLTRDRLGADLIVLPVKGNQSSYHTIFTGEPQNEYMKATIMDKLTTIEGIKQSTPQFFTQTLDESCCSMGKEIRLVGYDKNSDFILAPWLESQNMDYPLEDQAICGGNVPSFLGNVTILLGKRFTVSGKLYETGSGLDDTIFIDINVARKLAKNSPFFKDLFTDSDTNDLISSVLIKANDGYDIEKIMKDIEKLDLNVSVTSTNTVISLTKRQVESFSKVIWCLWIVILILSVITLWDRFAALTRNRRHEIGLMRAMGCSVGNVFMLMLTETVTLVLIGGIIGCILGGFFSIPAVEFIKKLMNISLGFHSIKMAIIYSLYGLGLSVVLGTLSCVPPCYFSAKMEPMSAIGKGELD